jgi:hypothetical protein
VKLEFSDPHLFHENILEGLELFRGMFFFVSLDIGHPRNENEKERYQKKQSTTPSENLSHDDSPFIS